MILQADEVTILKTKSIREALALLEKSKIKILLLVDEDNKLVGTCTDGDIRRAFLKSVKLSSPVYKIANLSPVTITDGFNPGLVKGLLRECNVRIIPVVSKDHKLIGLYSDDNAPSPSELDVPVVLMAGGLGRRLMPLTEDCPKPLLPLGGKPILQHIIERFAKQGFKRFFISVNYLGHMIEQHFGTGEHLGVEITYLREPQRLGTGGALSLLPKNMSFPFIVMNGDLLTDFNFKDLVDHHINSSSAATMCVREHRVSIPFGVVKIHGTHYLETEEKPTFTHHINAGIYCLSKDALECVPPSQFYDLPSVFKDLTDKAMQCSVHIMRDRWIDIGVISEYERADRQFTEARDRKASEPLDQ